MSTAIQNFGDPLAADGETPAVSRWKAIAARVEDSNLLSSLLAIVDQGMISGTNFLMAVVVGRCCGAETLGLYSLVASAIAMLMGIQEQLITAPYVMYHNRRSGKALKRYGGSILIHQAIFIAIVCAAMTLFVVGRTDSTQLSYAVTKILLFAMPAILFRAYIREVALAHCQTITVVMIDAAVCLSQCVAIAVLFLTDAVELTSIYVVSGIACLLTTLVWLQRNWSRLTFSGRAIGLDWIRNWRFGRWALATHVAGTSTPYVMPWVLFVMHGKTATGFLASCSVIVGIANILLSGMSDFLTPRAAAAYATGGLPKLQRILSSMALISFAAIGSVCAVAYLFGESIINVLYDGQFAGAGELVGLLTLAVLFNALGNVAGNGLWALNQPRANFVADVITLTSAIGAALVFVKPYGPKGAAVAILVASAIGAAARFGIYQRCICDLRDENSVDQCEPNEIN